jgi:Rad3-related DNA helicase
MKLLNNKIDTYYNLEYVPRQDQIDGLKFLKESVQTGNKYMLLNLPTGVGKSYLSNMFVIWYLNYINDDAKFDILTNSKILQKQYVNEFSYIRSLEGRSNYNCEKYGCNCEDGLEVCKAKKVKCGTCPYLIAMNNYINSRISLTNFHMFNISNIYNAAIKTERKSNVLIIDEASDYESNFCDYLTTELNITSFVKCGFDGEHLIEYRNLIDEIEDIDVFIDKCKNYILPNLKKQ